MLSLLLMLAPPTCPALDRAAPSDLISSAPNLWVGRPLSYDTGLEGGRHPSFRAPRPPGEGQVETEMEIGKAGLFGIVTDQPVPIEVTIGRGGAPVPLVSTGSLPHCPDAYRVAWYRLTPGRYSVRASHLAAMRLAMAVIGGD